MVFLYKFLITLSWPYVAFFMYLRKKNGKEDIARFNERVGKPKMPRPKGELLWMHGASVGETISMLPLIEKYLATYPNLHIMVTSGTVTSANIMAKRLAKRAFHQYIPLDFPWCTKRFVKYWKPTAVLWFESDFWPSILTSISDNKIPMALVNGRISDKSFKGWKKWLPTLINQMLAKFDILLGQSKIDAERLIALGGKNVFFEGNLKFAAQPLSYDEKEYNKLKNQINGRKLYLLSSTHHNEEERFIPIFKKLKEEMPDLLTVIAPRHPHRGKDIEEAYKNAGFNTSRRSEGGEIAPDTDVYVADTMGELGLVYKLSPIVFIGGSLIPHGGQNFLECLHFSDAVIAGPHMHNFRLLMELTKECDAVIQKDDEAGIQEALHKLLTDDEFLATHRANAEKFINSQSDVLDGLFKLVDKTVKIN